MKNLALDLDSGRLSRWLDDPRDFEGLSDRYGDLYTLRIRVYRSGGGKVPSTSLQFLVKKPQRRDAKALWELATFNRVSSFVTPSIAEYVGQVSAAGQSYREALKLDASPGNDLPKADFLGIVRAVTPNRVVEAEFSYELVNSGYRVADTDLGTLYVGLSDSGSILVRSIDRDEWRELVVLGFDGAASFALGETLLGPVNTVTLNDDYVRVQDGILQIKNDDNSQWVNVLLRGRNASTWALGENPPVGFKLSTDRYRVSDGGRLLLRNLNTGNWHEARVELDGGVNTLVLGTEYDDSQV
jgi:hypothetical protein